MVLLVRPQGIFGRASGSGRRAAWTCWILFDAGRSGLGPVAAVYALAAVGMNLQFGYTGLLNFGQVAFMLVGAYGIAVTVAVYGGPLWLGVLVGLLPPSCSRSCSASRPCGSAPTTWRSSPSRRGRSSGSSSIAGFARPVTGGVFGLQRSPATSTPQSVARPVPRARPADLTARDLWVILCRWGAVACASASACYLARAQPLGPGRQGIRED